LARPISALLRYHGTRQAWPEAGLTEAVW